MVSKEQSILKVLNRIDLSGTPCIMFVLRAQIQILKNRKNERMQQDFSDFIVNQQQLDSRIINSRLLEECNRFCPNQYV